MTLKLSSALGVALSALLLLPASGQANLTVGNDLTLAATTTASHCEIATPPCTYSTTGNHTGNVLPARSPVSGVVQSFGIKTSAPEAVTFRLTRFRQATATGAGVGPSATVPAGLSSVPASVPIEAGDSVGIDTDSTTALSCGAGLGGGFYLFHPTLTEGGPFEPADASSSCDLLVNAVVRPENRFRLRGLSRDRDAGTAIQTLDVSNPGRISVTGQGVRADAANVRVAGSTTLELAATGAKQRELRRHGTVGLRPTFTFTPQGGTARETRAAVTLIRR